MKRTWTLAGVAVFALFACGAFADDKPAPPRGRGRFPGNVEQAWTDR